MWPMLLDYTKEECKRILRKLELEAYSSVISALRAQGELTKEKKKLLQELCSTLRYIIPTERHRAEIRRAVNDEKLYTIAEIMGGSGSASDWAIEGRRLIPLLPRLVPQTAFSANANNAATSALQHNAKLQSPHTTGQKRVKTSSELVKTSSTAVNGSPSPSKQSQPSNSQCNVVFSSGMSIQIKDGMESETPSKNKKLKRSSDQSPHHKVSQEVASSHSISPVSTLSSSSTGTTRTVSIPIGANPMKITLNSPTNQKSTSTSTIAKSNSSINMSTQKVILVSTSGASLPPSILHRSLSIPVVKTVSATKTTASTGLSKFAPVFLLKKVLLFFFFHKAVKIITRTVPSGKLLPKSSSGMSQNITLTSGSSTARVVNVVTSQSGRSITSSSGDPSVVVVNAKALQSGAFKLGNAAASNVVRQAVNQVIAAGGSGNKPNVIVVKQSQLFPNSGNIFGRVMYGGQKPVSVSGNTSVKAITSSDQSLLKTLSLSASEPPNKCYIIGLNNCHICQVVMSLLPPRSFHVKSNNGSRPSQIVISIQHSSSSCHIFEAKVVNHDSPLNFVLSLSLDFSQILAPSPFLQVVSPNSPLPSSTEVKQSASKPNTLLADLMQASGIIYDNINMDVSSGSFNQEASVIPEKPPGTTDETKCINTPLKELSE
ncbi:BRCA2-interacting transcriptional repressor EMSY [Nymphon striatum]|nr:BRCA2-interacting transcriptional repressor EMSY [Nymphon striatum]